MMGLLGDKKKTVSMILGKHIGNESGLPPQSHEEKVEKDYVPALKSAAADMLSAIESRDADRLASALESFYDICEDKEHSIEGVDSFME